MKLFPLIITCLLSGSVAFAQEAPEHEKTALPDSSLTQPVFAPDGSQTTIGDVLQANKGKTILLYVWAMWCPDCLKGFPELYALKEANPEVHFLFLSLDREEQRWTDGISKYKLEGEHYWFKTGWKNVFTNGIDLNWIPRYLVIAPDGSIAHYYAVKASDPEIQQALDELKAK